MVVPNIFSFSLESPLLYLYLRKAESSHTHMHTHAHYMSKVMILFPDIV